jgi:predicted ribosome quality control (RQC) complex YloA/Tae2 family protein
MINKKAQEFIDKLEELKDWHVNCETYGNWGDIYIKADEAFSFKGRTDELNRTIGCSIDECLEEMIGCVAVNAKREEEENEEVTRLKNIIKEAKQKLEEIEND